MNDDESHINDTPPPRGPAAVVITPRGASEPREVLERREREQFRALVLAEAKKQGQLTADQQRYRQLKSDRRALLAQVERNEAETKEIEGRHARHLLKFE